MLPPNAPPSPKVFSFRARTGETLHGLFYVPPGTRLGQRLPTLLKIYAGPHAQLVTNDYKNPRFSQLFLAVKMGYAVVMIDGRGSFNRGVRFESYLKYRMGTLELEDQIDGLAYLAKEYDVIDPQRVAISGWSYGPSCDFVFLFLDRSSRAWI